MLLHRPYIDPIKNAELDLETSLKLSLKARREVIAYLQEMEVSEEYAAVMFSTPSDRAVPIDYESMRDKVAGYPLAVDEWLMAKCKISSFGRNKAQYDALDGTGEQGAKQAFQEQQNARNSCIYSVLNEKRHSAFDQWRDEYVQQHPPLSSPPPTPSTRLKPPPRWCIAGEPDCK